MSEKTTRARQRIAESRKREARRESRGRVLVWSGGALAIVAVVASAGWALSNKGGPALPATVSGTGTAPPPWPAPADALSGARAAGLSVEAGEGTAKHFHAHLAVIVDDQPVKVAANLGVDTAGGLMSELHTHDDSGLVHVEAPTATKRYTLGQLFSEWQVRLDERGIGGLEASGGKALRAYVDGKEVKGNPAAIELTSRRKITLVYGPAGEKVTLPPPYNFPEGT